MVGRKYSTIFGAGANVTSTEFIQLFQKFDEDGSGYLEKHEVEEFINDLIKNRSEKDVNKDQLQQFKEELFSGDDKNDTKVSLKELSNVLPKEQNFLLQYRDKSSINVVNFIKIFRKYDSDSNGYLEAKELKGFLHDLEEDDNNEMDPKKLDEYVNEMYEMFDRDGDKTIELTELAQLLPIEENFLESYDFKSLSASNISDIFKHYDQDKDGILQEEEIIGLIKNKVEKQGNEVNNIKELEKLSKEMLEKIGKQQLQENDLESFLILS